MLTYLSITKIPNEASAFRIVDDTKKEDIVEGQYLIRQMFDTKEEYQEARDAIGAILDSVKEKYPNSEFSFVMPGRPKQEFILELVDGKGFETRAWCKVKP